VRPRVLEYGYGIRPRLLFNLIRLVSGHPVPDAARLTFYRPEFYGAHMKQFTQAAMRGPSAWSVGDRELMAAYVSRVNDAPFCIAAHTATAALAYRDQGRVAAVLADLDSAPIEEGLRATLGMLGKLTCEGTVTADDIRAVLSTGISPQQIEDALAVGFAFNTTDRLANAFAFAMPSHEAFEAGANYLLKRGYG
jgi:AhpD family alkylhydroperoxidase